MKKSIAFVHMLEFWVEINNLYPPKPKIIFRSEVFLWMCTELHTTPVVRFQLNLARYVCTTPCTQGILLHYGKSMRSFRFFYYSITSIKTHKKRENQIFTITDKTILINILYVIVQNGLILHAVINILSNCCDVSYKI